MARVDTMDTMTFLRLRVLRSSVVGCLLLAVGSYHIRPGPRHRAGNLCRLRCRLQPVSADAGRSRGRGGDLPNGLRYYVRANAKPAHRAELRLVVKAGSVLEDDDQQGLAHFVEHMEFEGTRHFPRQSIIDFLSSLGLSIGPDANAATSYDDTQYTLRVPTDVPGVLDRALLVLEDWARARRSIRRGIDRERGIVLSEWRMHLGADERTGDKVRRVAARRVALRGPAADREAGVDRDAHSGSSCCGSTATGTGRI